jgi:hypothetical protein
MVHSDRPLALKIVGFFWRKANGAFRYSRQYRINKINKKIDKSYHEGYQFHQKEVHNDPELRAWVIKERYY